MKSCKRGLMSKINWLAIKVPTRFTFTIYKHLRPAFGALSQRGFVFGIIKRDEDEAIKNMAAFLLVSLCLQQYYITQMLRQAICLIVMLCVIYFKRIRQQMSRFGAIITNACVHQSVITTEGCK